jgi:hypothetical protein
MTLAHRSLCPSLALAPMILAALALGACASNPNKAKDLDTSIEKSEAINDRSSIGVKDGNMIYQKKVLIAEELRNLQIKTHEMESALYGGPRYLDNRGYWGVLKDCREQLSLLEDGKLKWAEKREYVIQDTDKVQMGLDEKGKIAGLTEEFLNDRLVRYREYKAVLEVRTEDMQEKVASCRLELKAKKKEKEKDQD